MPNPRFDACLALADHVRARPVPDPLHVAGLCASAAVLEGSTGPDALISDLSAAADRLLPASATGFERGVMIGAALALAMVPNE